MLGGDCEGLGGGGGEEQDPLQQSPFCGLGGKGGRKKGTGSERGEKTPGELMAPGTGLKERGDPYPMVFSRVQDAANSAKKPSGEQKLLEF